MSAARNDFVTRIGLIKTSLTEAAVNDGAPVDVRRNGIAAILRNGIAVLCFASLEAFVRERTAEILGSFDPAVVNFASLPEKLRNAVTLGALRGLNARVKFEPAISKINWAVTEASVIASSVSSVSRLSALSFGHESSNIDADDIKAILSSFGVHDGWKNITDLCRRIGLGGILDCKAAFENIASSRHAAAHNVATHTAIGDLTSHVQSVRGIGVCFDLLLSEACHRINKSMPLPPKNGCTLESLLKLRFLSPHPSQLSKFREQIELAAPNRGFRTYRVHANSSDARIAALPRCAASKEHLLEVDSSSIPQNWFNWS